MGFYIDHPGGILGDRDLLPGEMAADGLRLTHSLYPDLACNAGGPFPNGPHGAIRVFGDPTDNAYLILEKKRGMIELGIPILIIITILLQTLIPELVPLIALLVFTPVTGFGMVMTVTRHGERDGGRAIKR